MSRRRITEALLDDTNEILSDNKLTNKMVKLPTVKLSEKNNSIFSTKRQIVYSVSPDECRPWNFHDRDSSWLTEKKCADLISSIKLNGQKIPVLARESRTRDKSVKYDIIAGARRWFACKYLGRNIDITVTDANDKECSIFMHIENKERFDISDFERAINYKTLLNSRVFESQDALALSFGIKKSALSKMLTATNLIDYDFIFNYLKNIPSISIKPAYELSVLLKNKDVLSKIRKHMENIKKNHVLPSEKSLLKELLSIAKGLNNKEDCFIYQTPSKKSKISLKKNNGNISMKFKMPKADSEKKEIKNLFIHMIGEIIK
ncbi:MAG: ParB/RepB/Spo0J family partition protein [Legionellales bacterium]|nr:ParB/RepB/Spo0J family partition protein [Legionellales bacterium]